MNNLKNISDEELIRIAIQSGSKKEICNKINILCYGGSFRNLCKRLKELNFNSFQKIKKSPIYKLDLNKDVLIINSKYKKLYNFKQRLFDLKLLVNECYECKLTPWYNEMPLVLHIDHINGINNDNRLENLRVLCPNCHSQTSNYVGANKKKQSVAVIV